MTEAEADEEEEDAALDEAVDAGEDEGGRKMAGALVCGDSRFEASMRLLAIRLAKGRHEVPGSRTPATTRKGRIVLMRSCDVKDSRTRITGDPIRGPICRKKRGREKREEKRRKVGMDGWRGEERRAGARATA